jgi:hypothetical protein
VFPVGDGGSDIVLLALLGTTAEQDDEMLAVVAEINPVARTEIYLQSETPEPTPLTFDILPKESVVRAFANYHV